MLQRRLAIAHQFAPSSPSEPAWLSSLGQPAAPPASLARRQSGVEKIGDDLLQAGQPQEDQPQEDWNPARGLEDKDARWTKKNDEWRDLLRLTHLGVDKVHKLIRKWDATDASVHDSQKLDDVLGLSNTGDGVWADSAYRSVQIEAGLKARGLQSRIHRRAARDRPLSERQKSANTTRSKVRAPVEHLFGQQSSMGGKIVRTIGIVRRGSRSG